MWIKEAGERDASVVEEIFRILYRPEMKWSEEKIIGDIRRGKKYFLAFEGEVVLGAFEIEFGDSFAELCSIAVKKEHQRKGIGSALIECAEELARSKGLIKIFCKTLDWYNARKFYEKKGWKLEEVIRDLFDGFDGYVYYKNLV